MVLTSTIPINVVSGLHVSVFTYLIYIISCSFTVMSHVSSQMMLMTGLLANLSNILFLIDVPGSTHTDIAIRLVLSYKTS